MYIIQQDYRSDLALANMINVKSRHCKIGRVQRKPNWPLQQPVHPVLPAHFRFPYVGTPSMPQPRTGDAYRPAWWEQVTC